MDFVAQIYRHATHDYAARAGTCVYNIILNTVHGPYSV